ncbi:peptidase [Burkholderia pseudomallei]|uniref:peptidase domain-containing ABC transporter n=1 Tax=Burkholderia pseudomallei TaxID=28450 RepID=UPI0009758A2E|nr:peptidase domain-containing ABC transporter [Burkholderia pseudomallei]OMV19882.1 ABC transporter permease [Burkholderia pseudomallei]CAJ3859917.1 peptidase [Burkholderia pseudomallei]CAJ6510753.1 peptidase [Burkholderia pseudomallei]CAJ8428404.1 peptidase [Burkholderia pseudomallei]
MWFNTNKVRPILQDEVTECGLACLAMIATWHGRDTTLRTLRNRYPVKIDSGLSFFDLMEIANDLGMRARGLQFEANEIDALKLPCILHWGMNHYVVLTKVCYGSVHIVDPALGETKLPLAQALTQITGYALELNPDIGFKHVGTSDKIRLGDYLVGLTGIRKSILLGVAGGIAAQLLLLLGPSYVQLTIDEALKKTDVDILYLLTILFGIVFLFDTLYANLVGNIKSYLRNIVSQQLSANMVGHLARLPIGYYLFHNTGDSISRVSSVSEIGRFLVDGLIGGLLNVFTCVITLVLMLYYSPVLAGISLAGMVLFALSRLAIQPQLQDAMSQILTRGAEADALLIENIRSAHSIKLLSSETSRSSLWVNAFTQKLQAVRQQERLQLLFDAISKGIVHVEQLVIVTYGAWLVMHGQSTIGIIYAFIQYKNLFADKFVDSIQLYVRRKVLQVHMDRVADVLQTETEEPAPDAPVRSIEHFDGSLSIRALTYTPKGGRRAILEDVNLDVPAGAKIAIVGRTGSGKTTLLNLICGLYPPAPGALFVGGVDLSEVNLRLYRKHVAAVTQSDQLFRGTIRDNITNFAPAPRLGAMHEAARLACIERDIDVLDNRYDTPLGDTQKFLSAGQMQRLLIARALYCEPRLLILDEFSSNLDQATTHEICRNVLTLPCTIVLVTHDASILSMVDRIYEIRDGRLADITPARQPELEVQK